MADCGLPQLLIGQAIIPVIGCIRIGVIERPELVIGKCLIRSKIDNCCATFSGHALWRKLSVVFDKEQTRRLVFF